MAGDRLVPRIDSALTASFHRALENGDRPAMEKDIAAALADGTPLQVAELLIAPALAQLYRAGRICEQQLAAMGGGFLLSDCLGELPWQAPDDIILRGLRGGSRLGTVSPHLGRET